MPQYNWLIKTANNPNAVHRVQVSPVMNQVVTTFEIRGNWNVINANENIYHVNRVNAEEREMCKLLNINDNTVSLFNNGERSIHKIR